MGVDVDFPDEYNVDVVGPVVRTSALLEPSELIRAAILRSLRGVRWEVTNE